MQKQTIHPIAQEEAMTTQRYCIQEKRKKACVLYVRPPEVCGVLPRLQEGVAHQQLNRALFLQELHGFWGHSADVGDVADFVSLRAEKKPVGDVVLAVENGKRCDFQPPDLFGYEEAARDTRHATRERSGATSSAELLPVQFDIHIHIKCKA